MKKYQEGTHQADVLYMPDDDGYSYALTVVDCSSRLTDARPLKTRDAQTVLNAIKDIYKGKILKQPNILQVDNGSDFKSVFKSYFEKQNVIIMTAQTGRHRQIALAEARNGAISKPLLTRMVAEELVTGEQSNDWVKFLPDVIKMLNEHYEIKDAKQPSEKIEYHHKDKIVYDIGTLVRYKLDAPVSVTTGKKIDSKFRNGDVRYSLKPVKIIATIIDPNMNVVMYRLDGKTALYSADQLMLVSDKLNLPPDTVQTKFIIEKILKKKTIKGKTFYVVKWKGYDKTTDEPESQLIKDVPDLIKEFNKK